MGDAHSHLRRSNHGIAIAPSACKHKKSAIGDQDEERLVFSHRRASSDAEMQNFRKGDLVTGVVQSIKEYGAFLDIGGGTGLLHISQITHERLTSVEQVLQVGDELKVLILSVNKDERRISLSTKKLEANPGDMLRDRQLVFAGAEAMAQAFRERVTSAEEQERLEYSQVLDNLCVGDLVTGVVQIVKGYGAFVDIGGATGLLHISQITSERLTSVQQVLQVGDKLKVMILGVNKKRKRITLSTRKLEANPGDMLRDRQLVFAGAEAMAQAFRERLNRQDKK
eukprot:gene2313-2621_t